MPGTDMVSGIFCFDCMGAPRDKQGAFGSLVRACPCLGAAFWWVAPFVLMAQGH